MNILDKAWRHIKSIPYRISNIIRWIPVLWCDADFDYTHLYKIMRTKIRHMRERNERIHLYVGSEIDAKWMKICERLLDRLIDGGYWLDEYDNKPLNIRNTPYISDFYKEVHTPQNGFDCEIREIKARRLLFKILDWRTPYWWD